MSAIGNYIHWTAAGYNRTGTNTQREAPSIDAATALGEERESIKQRIDNYRKMNDLSSLERKINEFLDILGNRTDPPKKNWDDQARQFIIEYLDSIHESLQNVDFNNANVSYYSEKSKKIDPFWSDSAIFGPKFFNSWSYRRLDNLSWCLWRRNLRFKG